MNFRFLNIPVRIHPTFWIFWLFFTDICRDPSIEAVIAGIVVFFSLLVHEYGHAIAAVCFGGRPTITLEAFGGHARYNGVGMTSKQHFLVTLNGPLFTGLLIIFSYALLKLDFVGDHRYIHYFLYVTMRLNIILGLFNLIPLVPLDGGYLARYVLEKKFGDIGLRASIIIGLICVLLVAPYLFYERFFIFGALLLIYGFQNFRELQRCMGSSGGNSPFSCYMQGIEAIKNNEIEKAKAILKKLLRSKNIQIKHSAIESLAQIYFQENESQKSYHLLLKADHQSLKEGKCLLCKLAFERKNYELVGKYSRDIYAIEPSYEIALLNSRAFAYLKQPALSVGWLVTASQFGVEQKEKVKDLVSNQMYDFVRGHEAFKKLQF